MNRIDFLNVNPATSVSVSRHRWLALVAFLLSLGLGSVASIASAATCTWIGTGADNDWSTSGNWNTCAAGPADGDTVVFPVAAANRSNINDLVGLDLAQIVFSGTNYVIRGNPITLSGGISSSVALGGSSDLDPDFGIDVTLVAAGQVVQCLGVRGLTLSGAFDLGGFGLGFDGVCPIRLEGTTSGGGGLTKAGTGTLILSAANTYTGVTNVNAGTLVIRDSQALGANGTQDLQNGVAVAQGGTLVLDASLEVVDEPLTLNGSGGVGGGGGALQTLSGNSVWTGGPVFLGSDTMVSTASGTGLKIRPLVLDPTAVGGAGITKIGAGTLELSGDNTYRGTTTVADGVLRVASNLALGATGAASGASILTGATIETDSGVTAIDETLTLSGTGFGGAGAVHVPTGSVVFKDIVLAADASVAVGSGATLTVSGNTSGSANLTKELTGTLVLSGNNTYTGNTFINSGTLTVQSAGALGGTGNGTTVSNGATLQLQGSLTIAGEPLILNGPGFNNTGALRNLSGSNTWNGSIVLASATTIDSGADGHQLTLAGNTSGSGNLTKIGTGTLILPSSNSYSGMTDIQQGVVVLSSGGALGTAAGGTAVNNGASLHLSGGVTVPGEPLTFNGHATGALRNVSGNNTYTGPLTLATGTSIANDAIGTSLSLGGSTSGVGGLTKEGPGTLVLTGANTYTGATFVNAGILQVQSNTALGATGAASGTTVLDGAQLQIQGSATINESLTLNGFGVGGTGAVRASGSVYTITFGGTLSGATDTSIETDAGGTLTLAGNSSGTGGLTKTGAGTLTLAGSNTYTGATTINGGILLLTGSVTAVTVNTGARLAGDGTAGAITLNDGGMISPTGTLSASSLLWNGDGVIEIGFDGLAGGSDRLQLAGAMQKGGDAQGFFRLFGDADGDGSADPVPGITYVLTTYASTTFVEADFSFDYVGAPGAAMTGEFIVTSNQVEFVPTTVSLFQDGFEDL